MSSSLRSYLYQNSVFYNNQMKNLKLDLTNNLGMYSNSKDEPFVNNQCQTSSKFKRRYELIKSARQRREQKKCPWEQEQNDRKSFKKTQRIEQKSKFLDRFDQIKSSRKHYDQQMNKVIHQQFETNKKKMFLDQKNSTSSTQKSQLLVQNQQLFEFQSQTRQMKLPKRTRLTTPPQSKQMPSLLGHLESIKLPTFSIDKLIFIKEDDEKNKSRQEKKQKNTNFITAFWRGENQYVSLIPLQKNQQLIFNHPNILPIYGEITVSNQRFIISDQYKNSTLQQLIEEFGPLSQDLARRYLKQIARGLQHLHFLKISHNRLNPKNILYNKNGQLFINMVSSTSKPPTEKEKISGLHYFSPELIYAKQPGRFSRSDVWALGCIAITMMTGNLQKSKYHPYNYTNSHQLRNQEETILENLRMSYPTLFEQKKVDQNSQSLELVIPKLSNSAINFVRTCLSLRQDLRPSLQFLLIEHEFFQEV